MHVQDFLQGMTKTVPLPTTLVAGIRTLPTLLTVALVLLPGNLLAQREKQPLFTAESEVVRIDLIVTDKKGRFVSDLQAHEIQVWEDGRKQKIISFQRQGQDDISAAQNERQPPLPGDTPAAQPSEGAHFVVLLDLESLSFNSLLRTKRSLEEFLQSELGGAGSGHAGEHQAGLAHPPVLYQ